MHRTGHAQKAIANRVLGKDVARHKSMFFAENDATQSRIDYHQAVGGSIQIVPAGGSLESLRSDYIAMLEDGLIASDSPTFEDVMETCRSLQETINRPTAT